ncbi:hypothetical protein V1511DRAFT_499916 [Dipodascopsis uninucleata]
MTLIESKDIEFESLSDSFMQWLISSPGVSISNKITLKDLRAQHQGRGVVAEEDILEDELLFEIPRSLLLNVYNTGVIEKIPELNELGPWLALIVAMMVENRKDSKWRTYYDVLPTQFTTPMFWSDKDLDELKGTTVIQNLGKEDAENDYIEKVVPIIKAHMDVFSKVDHSLEAFHRMGSLILSYSFDVERESFDNVSPDDETENIESENENDIEELNESDLESSDEDEVEEGLDSDDEKRFEEEEIEVEEENEEDRYIKSMVPLADMLNGDSDLCNAKLFYCSETLQMRAIKPIAKGEQVYNTYGDLPNADLLRRYGYVRFGKTANDCVEIDTQKVIDRVAAGNLKELHLKKRIEFLVKVDESEDMEILDESIELSHSALAIPTSALLLSHTLLLTAPAFRSLQKQGSKALMHLSRRELKSAELQELWVSILKQKLSEYKTDIVTDENLILETKFEDNANLRNAIEIRLSEKRILKSALDKIAEWKIKNLKRRKEYINKNSKKMKI